jgi:hypothetical protein
MYPTLLMSNDKRKLLLSYLHCLPAASLLLIELNTLCSGCGAQRLLHCDYRYQTLSPSCLAAVIAGVNYTHRLRWGGGTGLKNITMQTWLFTGVLSKSWVPTGEQHLQTLYKANQETKQNVR